MGIVIKFFVALAIIGFLYGMFVSFEIDVVLSRAWGFISGLPWGYIFAGLGILAAIIVIILLIGHGRAKKEEARLRSMSSYRSNRSSFSASKERLVYPCSVCGRKESEFMRTTCADCDPPDHRD